MNVATTHHASYYAAVFTPRAHFRFLHMWSSWQNFSDAIITRTTRECLSDPTVWARLGWTGVVRVRVEGCECAQEVDEDQELLFLHFMVMISVVHQLLHFAALYQTWP